MSPPSLAVTAGMSVVLLVLGLGRLLTADRPRSMRRAPRHAERPAGPVARTRWGRALARRLESGGSPLGAGAFASVVVMLAAVAALASVVVAGMPLLAPASGGLVLVAAVAVVRAGDARRLTRITDQLPQVAQALAASLSAGLSLRQALTRVARDAPEPIAGELRLVVDELRLGARLETALECLAARVPARDLRVMVTAIDVQRRTGGNLARALGALAERLDERGRLARELRGATAQARLTAWLVAALPVGAGAMAEVAAPGTLRGALGQPPGSWLCLVAVAMYGAGVMWVRRIGSVEP